MAKQKNDPWKRKRPEACDAPGLRVHSPALAWLSLVALLLSRAQLCFARQENHTRKKPRTTPDTSQMRPPGNASIVVRGYQPKAPTGSRQTPSRQNPQNLPLPSGKMEGITGRNHFIHWLV